MTDLPAPPLVEKTVMSRPYPLGAPGASVARVLGVTVASVPPTRSTARASSPAGTGAASTSFTPARSAR